MTDTIVPVAQVRPDPEQPRKYFKPAALKALARSLQLVGQRTPIQVRALDAGEKHRYEIIDGERRWRAHKIAGIETIHVVVEKQAINRRRQHLLSMVSNFHREGHTHMEISDALQYQHTRGASIRELTENLDRSDAWVYSYLKLQSLAKDLQPLMHPDTPDAEMIRFGEGVVLASLPADRQRALYREGLQYERGERLALYRKRASSIQGHARVGRKMRAAERVKRCDTFIRKMNQYVELSLDLREREFEEMLAAAGAAEVRSLVKRLEKLRTDIGIVLNVVKQKAHPLRKAS